MFALTSTSHIQLGPELKATLPIISVVAFLAHIPLPVEVIPRGLGILLFHILDAGPASAC